MGEMITDSRSSLVPGSESVPMSSGKDFSIGGQDSWAPVPPGSLTSTMTYGKYLSLLHQLGSALHWSWESKVAGIMHASVGVV